MFINTPASLPADLDAKLKLASYESLLIQRILSMYLMTFASEQGLT